VLESWSKYGDKEKERVVKSFEVQTFEEAKKIYCDYKEKHPKKSNQSYMLSERVW